MHRTNDQDISASRCTFPSPSPVEQRYLFIGKSADLLTQSNYLRYIIDPFKLKEFESYGKIWIPLVEKFGGKHHGYFLPSEGANNVALAMFTFQSLALYEEYRDKSLQDPECLAAYKYAEDTRCIISYERIFFRPVFE
ncbi:MAG: NIPSNAP family protein [Betaproteobacteria bacterium]|nr:NIPSNAP family protein [Betaproteobacteria bacterium]